MFSAAKEIELDAGHRVPYHDSKCRHLHGHRYRVRATICAEDVLRPDPSNPRSGMILDFGEIKNALIEQVHDKYDHRLILWEKDEMIERIPEDYGLVVVSVIPTAEELARLFYYDVNNFLLDRCSSFVDGMAWLAKIEVWETPTSLATYNGPVE